MGRFLLLGLGLLCCLPVAFAWFFDEEDQDTCQLGNCGGSSPAVDEITKMLTPALESCLESHSGSMEELMVCVSYHHGIIDTEGNVDMEQMAQLFAGLFSRIRSAEESIIDRSTLLDGPDSLPQNGMCPYA